MRAARRDMMVVVYKDCDWVLQEGYLLARITRHLIGETALMFVFFINYRLHIVYTGPYVMKFSL